MEFKEILKEFQVKGLSLLGCGLILGGAVEMAGCGGGSDAIEMNSGAVVRVDESSRSAEVDTSALGITDANEETAGKAGAPITVSCIDFHRSEAGPLQTGDTLTELAKEEVSINSPQIPEEAAADAIAAYNGVRPADVQIGVTYQVPQLCFIDN